MTTLIPQGLSLTLAKVLQKKTPLLPRTPGCRYGPERERQGSGCLSDDEKEDSQTEPRCTAK
jgi:hypothetical protein